MSKEIVKKETGLVEFNANEMFDDMEIPAGRRKMPMIKLLQSNSNEVAEEGEKIGTYYNSLTKDNYGEGFKFVPVKFYFGAAYLELSKGLICKSIDGIVSVDGKKCSECEFYYKNWINRSKPNKCIDTIDVIGVVVAGDIIEPAILGFKSKSYPAGDEMARSIRKLIKLGNPAIHEFVVHSSLDSNDKGRYFITKVNRPVVVDNQDVLKVVHETYKLVKEQSYEVHEGGDNGSIRQAN